MTNYPPGARYNTGMEIIYIDSYFLLNFIIDYLLCVCTGQVCLVRLRRGRYFLAASLGAVYACAALLPRLGFLSAPVFKLIIAMLMALISFGGERRLMRCAVTFIAVSGAFAGLIWALALAGAYPAFDMRTMLLSFAICYILLRAVFKGRVKLMEKERAEITLRLGAREARFMALIDTGNQLTDPVSGAPVMIICPHAAAPLFGAHAELAALDAVSLVQLSSDIPELKGRMRLIPYAFIGGRGMLAAIHPDAALVDGAPRELLAAISADAAGDGYEGII